MRAYALEQLRAHDEYDTIAQRHAEYILALAEEAASAMDGPEQAAWMDRLEAVHDAFAQACAGLSTPGINRLDSAWRLRSNRSGGRAATLLKAAIGSPCSCPMWDRRLRVRCMPER